MNGTKAWLIGISFLASYEAYAIAHGKQTLSEAVWSAETASPIVPFGFGFLMGHLVFQTIREGRPS